MNSEGRRRGGIRNCACTLRRWGNAWRARPPARGARRRRLMHLLLMAGPSVYAVNEQSQLEYQRLVEARTDPRIGPRRSTGRPRAALPARLRIYSRPDRGPFLNSRLAEPESALLTLKQTRAGASRWKRDRSRSAVPNDGSVGWP